MGFWTNRLNRSVADGAEDLAYPPTGGRVKMWLLGVGLALVPFGYGVRCLWTGHAVFFGRSSNLEVTGGTAVAMAIAYMSVGLFIHAHWFWGLRARGEGVSDLLKLLAVVTFLGSFGNAVWRIVSE